MDQDLTAAVALHRQGRLAEAETAYRRILARAPDRPEAHNALGIALLQTGRVAEAEACFLRAVALRPAYAAAQGNLGAALVAQGRTTEATATLVRALALDPNLTDARYNLAWAAQMEGRLDEAEQGYRRVVERAPGHGGAHNNLALLLRSVGRLDEVLPHYREAARLAPGNPVVRYGLAQALLAAGCFAEGWAEHESRFAAGISRERHSHLPRWRGEPAAGQAILAWAEQGLGDTLHFCRYASLLAKSGARVTLEVQEPLARLLNGLDGVQVMARGQALPDGLAAQVPLMSLPGLLRPAPFRSAPYLAPPPDLAKIWAERLGPRRKPRVALAWRGSPTHKDDANRSIAAARLAPLLAVRGVELFSLQKESGDPVPDGIADLGPHLGDMADTAAALAGMDLLIAVDTSVLHLAGATGIPAWGLLPLMADWRWGSRGETTEWYPSLRLFRQPGRGDWETVLGQASQALAAFVASG